MFSIMKIHRRLKRTNALYNVCTQPRHQSNRVDFTKNRYNVERAYYNYLQDHHVSFFRGILGDNRILTNLCDLEKYNVDVYRKLRGSSSIVLKPKTTDEVSKILEFCDNNKLAVCPQGGNTGIVGGATPVFDEIIISSELMNEIVDLDETSGTLVCQAGCILQNLDEYLAGKNLMVPLDLGSRGSCQIGGNVSTNAGGTRLARLGNLHGNVLGLEVVKANGEVLDCLSTLKKDNTGYHLKHLFIGAEGTLGVVTKVALQCPPRFKSINVAFLGCENFETVLKTYRRAKQDLGEILSAVEVMDAATMEFVKATLEKTSPIGDYPFYLLVETAGSCEKHDSEKLDEFLDTVMNKHLVSNGTVATDEKKIREIWSVRETIPEGFQKCGYVFLYDVTLPLEHYYTLVNDMKEHMGRLAKRVYGFGHLGDGNLHLQIEVKEYSKEINDHIEPFVFERTAQLKGSISAEHGMGFLKRKYLHLANAPSAVKAMRNVKKMFDPNAIMNPYKIFP